MTYTKDQITRGIRKWVHGQTIQCNGETCTIIKNEILKAIDAEVEYDRKNFQTAEEEADWIEYADRM